MLSAAVSGIALQGAHCTSRSQGKKGPLFPRHFIRSIP
jgi:hypothetical protein